ncbi:glucosidase 2 subunit beta [Raphidocelis subcapitata]|uniref:Glucosidase 2 subunit beta n=1 Tax=Raphidocelis subcapitata TaxID=307507 RepID=A0A2V0PII1_9CHLO|nr:glucosidase 2 subunit beta [Raphidocelis subcapitata]|eukprot:GBF96865.1 glucosidase 2 subunit beta [Raphidocelis subcapitata]
MRAALGLLLLLAACAGGVAAHVRGVRPELAAKYEGEEFTCLDGSLTLPASAINDDWCQCPDGSDEPGTSACGNGVFYCRNRGHEPKVMSTAFVDDGVCDCCDGTDELEGCKNTCIEKNAAVREGLLQQVDEYKQALAKRRDYAAGAAQERKDMKERLGSIDSDIEAAGKEVVRLAGERDALIGTAEERRAVRQEKLRAEAAQRAAEEAETKAKAAADAEKAAAAAAEQQQQEQEQQQEQQQQAAGEGEAEETEEERGRRIAAQWTKDPAAAGAAASKPSGDAAAPAAPEGGEAQAAGGEEGDKGWLQSTWSKLKGAVSGEAPSPPPPPPCDEEWDASCPHPEEGEADAEEGEGDEGYSPAPDDDEEPFTPAQEDADSDPELEGANSAYAAAEERVTALKGEKELLQRQVTFDYGADDAWLALSRHCAEAREPQYTYRLCLFDRAAQVDNGAGHETNLGKWRGFEKGYTEGVFENGDWCHQAPARSMRVTFVCGTDEAAWGGGEPSTCAYAATMSTPAACKEEQLKALEDRLAALIREEEELAGEIAAEEAARAAALKAQREAAEAARDEL